jgi:hypothetical protein
VNELVVWVGLPVNRFTTARHYNARPVARFASFDFHGRRQVHQAGHGTQNALRVVNQSHQLPEVGFTSQINYSIELWMVVVLLSDLHENDLALEVINDFLIALGLPPFYRHIKLAPGDDDPERGVRSGHLAHLREPALLQIGNIDVPFELAGFDVETETLVQEFGEPMDAVMRRIITPVNQWILAIDHLGVGVVLFQWSDMRIVLPQFRAGRAQISHKLARVRPVQVTNSRRQHHDVTRGEVVSQNEFPHKM